MKPFGRCRSSYFSSAVLSRARLGSLGQRMTLGVPGDARVGPALTGRRGGRGLQWDSTDSRFTVEEYKVVCLVKVGYTIGRLDESYSCPSGPCGTICVRCSHGLRLGDGSSSYCS
jgi:hypothetical protein